MISIFGASGCGNVGDDLLAFVLKELLQDGLPGREIVVYPQHERRAIERSDVVVIGGGGLIYDYDFENVTNYTDIIYRAADQQIPVYLMGLGVQHVFSDRAKDAYRNAFQYVRAISTRNDADTDFLIKELGYPANKIVTARDLAFLAPQFAPEHAVPTALASDKPVLLISLADWKLGKANYESIEEGLNQQQQEYRKYIVTQLEKLSNEYNVQLVCQAREDQSLYKQIAAKADIDIISFEGIDDSIKLIDVYAAADYVITGRYHGLIAATVSRKPVISVSYGGHKQTKLINDSFPSLSKQYFDVGGFVREDILGKMLDPVFVQNLKAPSAKELVAAEKLAAKNYDMIRMIRTEILL